MTDSLDLSRETHSAKTFLLRRPRGKRRCVGPVRPSPAQSGLAAALCRPRGESRNGRDRTRYKQKLQASSAPSAPFSTPRTFFNVSLNLPLPALPSGIVSLIDSFTCPLRAPARGPAREAREQERRRHEQREVRSPVRDGFLSQKRPYNRLVVGRGPVVCKNYSAQQSLIYPQ